MLKFIHTELANEELLNAIKYLVWLLPIPNRDTLKVALGCIANVAAHSEDRLDAEGILVCVSTSVLFLIVFNAMDVPCIIYNALYLY